MVHRTASIAATLGIVVLAMNACNSHDSTSYAGGIVGSGGTSTSTQVTPGGAGATNSGGATASSGGQVSSGGNPATGAAGFSSLNTPLPPIDCRRKGDGRTSLSLVNHCSQALEARGSNWNGKNLVPGGYVCLDLGSDTETLSSLRYWGSLGEDPGGEHHTLAEFTLNTDFNDFDWYNLSHVDAHNLPMAILPVDMTNCRTLSCAKSLLADCPAIGQYRDSHGTLTSCVSPDRNNATSPVALYFDAACVDAYSWSGDDAQSMVACAGEDYDVVFCP